MIDIVVATYNPNKYLDEQIDSILNQTYIDKVSRIILIDDYSDNEFYIKKNLEKDARIEFHKSSHALRGAKYNFSDGLSKTTSKYIMTCDQDDFWLPNKIEVSLNELLRLEAEKKNAPLLVATDVKIVNERLELIDESFLCYRNVELDRDADFDKILFKNIVPGCTMLFNRHLLSLALPIPEEAMMHDWWLLLVAAFKGKISIIPIQTMLYRQHSSNCLGAKKKTILQAYQSRSIMENFQLVSQHVNNVMSQSETFYMRYVNQDVHREVYPLTCKFKKYNASNKIKYVIRNFRLGFVKNIGYIISSVLGK